MKTEKRLVLKRHWLVLITIILTLFIEFLIKTSINDYRDYLHRCDVQKGYTCNIFGR